MSFLILFFSVAPNFLLIHAQNPPLQPAEQGTWYNQDYFSWFHKVYDPGNESDIFGERYTAAQVQWVIYGLFAFIMNSTGNAEVLSCVLSNTVDLSNCSSAIQTLVSQFPKSPPLASNNENLLSLVFADRPISGVGYVKEKFNSFKLIPEAKAQTVGFGFTALRPIQDMWRGTRNVAFGLFVLVSVIFSFMIMFRIKINPQTIITVQSAIPKVIISLVLVTFSYAIAGFLIDLMYVVIGLLSVVLASFSPIFNSGSGSLQSLGVFHFLVYGQPLGELQLGPIQVGGQATIFGFLFIMTAPLIIGLGILTFVAAAVAGSFSGGILAIIPLLLYIIVVVVTIWIAIRTVWDLFRAFANVILSTIFAPLQITLGVLIPNFGFGQWVRNYISYLSVFVVTGVTGFLSILFTVHGLLYGAMGITGGNVLVQYLLIPITNVLAPGSVPSALQPPPVGAWPPLLGSGNGVWIGILFLGVAFVLFTIIPKASDMVQAFIQGKQYSYGSGVGEAFGPLSTFWGYTGGAAFQNWQRNSQWWDAQWKSFREEMQARFGRKQTGSPPTPAGARDQNPDL